MFTKNVNIFFKKNENSYEALMRFLKKLYVLIFLILYALTHLDNLFVRVYSVTINYISIIIIMPVEIPFLLNILFIFFPL